MKSHPDFEPWGLAQTNESGVRKAAAAPKSESELAAVAFSKSIPLGNQGKQGRESSSISGISHRLRGEKSVI